MSIATQTAATKVITIFINEGRDDNGKEQYTPYQVKASFQQGSTRTANDSTGNEFNPNLIAATELRALDGSILPIDPSPENRDLFGVGTLTDPNKATQIRVVKVATPFKQQVPDWGLYG